MAVLTEDEYRQIVDYASGIKDDDKIPDYALSRITFIEAARRFHFEKLQEEKEEGLPFDIYRSKLMWFLIFLKTHPKFFLVSGIEAAKQITTLVRYAYGDPTESWRAFCDHWDFDEEDAFSEIAITWPKLSPLFGALRWAIACAGQSPFLSEYCGENPGSTYARILDVAGHLQRFKGIGNEILLPRPDLGKYLGKDPTTIGYHIGRAELAGVLTRIRVSRGQGDAAGYLCNLPHELCSEEYVDDPFEQPPAGTDSFAA